MDEAQMGEQERLLIAGLSSESRWDFENGYHWFSHPTRMGKLLAQYELYKSIASLPGDILELGVYKGASLVRFATFRQILESEYSRKIVGFDAFGKFPKTNLKIKEDINFVSIFEAEAGDGLSRVDLDRVLRRKKFENYELYEGDVFESLPAYLNKFPETRISLLHLDMDVKEPTAFALNLLYDRVVPGGLIVLDDYAAVAGATEAVDSFFKSRTVKLEKLGHYAAPCYVRKIS